jgi:hypothetical protein
MNWFNIYLTKLLFGKEVDIIVTVYVTLIIKDAKRFEEVPVKLQPAVEAELLAMGLDRNGDPIIVA